MKENYKQKLIDFLTLNKGKSFNITQLRDNAMVTLPYLYPILEQLKEENKIVDEYKLINGRSNRFISLRE
jgi:hypothetical protein